MWLKWFPWKFVIKQVAQAQGFLDPILLLSHFNQFAQPSEVWAPVELMRAGAVFHARGLINSQVIQHNLDWVWPYWAERQFDPIDRSFIPRAFSVTHINLTHRNWTAVGLPGLSELPVIDSRGLVMPFFDSWSIDAWIVLQNNQQLIPSRMQDAQQQLVFNSNLQLITSFKEKEISLSACTEVLLNNGLPYCQIAFSAQVPSDGLLFVALRPYNPEGISFIHEINLLASQMGWRTDSNRFIFFNKKPAFYRFSNYKHGDVFHWIHSATPATQKQIVCDVGLATAFAAYECSPQTPQQVTVQIPLDNKKNKNLFAANTKVDTLWKQNMAGAAECVFPYKKFDQLYANALRSLIIHTPEESYAGPYTYKRFWFRDAAFIVNALLLAGLPTRAYRIISTFFKRQTKNGYFMSQEGEWDSNGQALWAMNQYLQITNSDDCKEWYDSVYSACQWTMKKRVYKPSQPLFDGLFPPGFSAEHLGPNDYYYWDNFWGIAGLQAAVSMLKRWKKTELIPTLNKEIETWFASIDRSLITTAGEKRRPIMPASPNRRPDSGSVGSLAAGYPLQLWDPSDERLLLTAGYLIDNCCIDHAFYHNISHSGINPYLTLHIAEVLLRASDQRFSDLTETIGALASQSGQWPEAIHPQLKTGCMGDGQHIWAAAEWMIIIRNCFIREEGESLILCQGIFDKVLLNSKKCTFGYAPTIFGPVKCSISKQKGNLRVEWNGKWFDREPQIIIKMPGFEPVTAQNGQNQCDLPYKGTE
jgi:hypothetical protein